MGSENNKKEDIEKIVKDVIVAGFKINAEKVKVGATLKQDLGMDSFDAVELVFELKAKFGFEIPQEDYKNINTVGDIVEYLLTHLNRS